MKDFYFQYYSDSTYYEGHGAREIPKDWYCCFGRFTKSYLNDIVEEDFKVTLFKLGSELMTKKGYNNVCLFNKTEIKKHLEEIQEVHPFTYNIEQYKNRYVISIHIKAHILYIKFVLTWLRLLYEYPYNILYKDTLKLYKVKAFSNMNLISIFNLVSSTMVSCVNGISNENSFIYPRRFTEPLTYKEIKASIENLKEKGLNWVNFIFPVITTEGPFVYPDVDYDRYSDDLFDIIYGGGISLEATPDSLKDVYGLGERVTHEGLPINPIFKRPNELPFDVRSSKEWFSGKNYKIRLGYYKENLRIFNDYLKTKK